MQHYDNTRPVVLMHVPKTSGTALTDGLSALLAPASTVLGFDRVLFGAFNDFDSLSPDQKRFIYLDPVELPLCADLIAGHLSFSTLRHRYPKGQFFTFFREPVSRLLSHWLYWRGQTDESLIRWGRWGDIVRSSRNSLTNFLSNKQAACQTDNVCLRMLLWPHTIIPDDNFIETGNDAALLHEAVQRLMQFDYADIIENPSFQKSIENWFGSPFRYSKINETGPIPKAFRIPLYSEFTSDALHLIELRSRLDRQLWIKLAAFRKLPDIEILREQTIIKNISRYAYLMG